MSIDREVLSWLKHDDFRETMDYLKKKLNKGKLRLFLDINKYHKKYKADYNDYKFFKMYEKSPDTLNTYITNGINEEYITRYNKTKEINIPNKLKIYKDNKLPKQNEELNHLNTKPCIFKFLVFQDNIIASILEISKDKKIYASINLETGIIDYPAVNLNGKIYEKSPTTKEDIIWFRIPKWPRICRYVQNIATNINHKYIEISIYLDEEGPILVGINNPTYYLYQLHIDNIQEKGIKFLIEERENNK
jgi:hypothetical protein